MKIPKSFQVGPHFWRVYFVTADVMAKRAGHDDPLTVCEGYTDFRACEVLLLRSSKQRSRAYVEHTFCHEMIHILCVAGGLPKLGEDEGKVDALGGLLMQALNSMK